MPAQLLGQAYTVGALSARGRHRVLRVARTIADLERSRRVTRDHVLSALALRQRAGVAAEEVGAPMA
jgi:magnesium chelatase family protein